LRFLFYVLLLFLLYIFFIASCAFHKRYYVENRERIQTRQKRGRTARERRDSHAKPVVKDRMKTTRNGSSGARQHIIKRTRNTSTITEDNTVKTTGNG